MEDTAPSDLDYTSIVRQRTFLSYIIWVAFTVSAFVYGLVCFLIVGEADAESTIDPILTTAFIGIAIVCSLIALTINKKLSEPDTVLKRLASPNAGKQIAAIREKHPKLSQIEACQVHLLPLLLFKTVLSMAFIETVLILGLVLAINSQNTAYYFYFAAPAFILQLSICPRPQPFLTMCKEVMRTVTQQTQEPSGETQEEE